MEGVELKAVRIYKGRQRLSAFVKDGDRLREISYVWKTRDRQDAPPDDWWQAIEGEIECIRAQEVKEAQGRLVRL